MNIPDHKLISKIGEGAYGEIWLASNVTGVYRAIKIIHRDRFEHDRPYEREFNGIQKYEPVSREHGSLIQVLHVGRDEKKGYFYYIMELADDQHAGQEINPRTYKPKTLRSELTARENLPINECLEQGAHIARALAHMHQRGLVHRDVKPANIVYVNGVPKLADIGLVKALDDSVSFAGTIGYVPLEGPGRPSGDVFSLGKVLYEMVTGMDRTEFPELPESFKDDSRPGLAKLNQVIFKACEHKPEKRHQKADDLAEDLEKLVGQDFTTARPTAVGSFQPMKLVATLAVIVALILAYYNFRGGPNNPSDEPGTGKEPAPQVDKYAYLNDGVRIVYRFPNGEPKDESGNENHGEAKGTAPIADRHGTKNAACKFNGTDSIILMDGDHLDIFGRKEPSAIAISLYPKAAKSEQGILTKGFHAVHDIGLGNQYLQITLSTVGLKGTLHYSLYSLGNGPGQLIKSKADAINLNAWNHVVFVRDKIGRIYVNGEDVTDYPAGKNEGWFVDFGPFLSNKITLGAQQFRSTENPRYHLHYFNGVMDNFRVYNRALSEKEVKDLHEMEKSGGTIASTSPKATEPTTSLNKGLIAYYPFSGNAKDESGNGNHGEVNGPRLTAGRHGKTNSAYSFDGTDDFIDLGDKPAFDFGTGDFTISLWFQASGNQSNKYIIAKFHGAKYPAFGIGTHDRPPSTGETKAYTFINDGGEPISVEAIGTSNMGDGNWHHMLVVFDRDEKMSIYLDGIVEVSSAISGEQESISNDYNLYIGRLHEGLAHFGGKIDDVRIYNRALSEKEVKDLHEMEKSGDTIASTSPKATKPKTFNLTDLVEKNGIYHHKGTGKPVTGKVTTLRMANTEFRTKLKKRKEFNVVNGIKHGQYKEWYANGEISSQACIAVYRMGELIMYQEWGGYNYEANSPQLRWKHWRGSTAPNQVIKEGWNQDGTPTKEKASILNTSALSYNLADTEEINGIFYLKDTDNPVTGRIFKLMQGEFQEVFNVKTGIKDGRYRRWQVEEGKVITELLSQVAVYQAGKLIRNRVFESTRNVEWWDAKKYWKDSPYPYQVKLSEWNRDGTPKTSLDKGLVAYYPFNGSARDESGHGNNAQVKGATLIPDRHGIKDSAYDFDGKDDYIEVAAMNPGPKPKDSSVTLWVKLSKEKKGQLISIGAPRCGFFVHPTRGYMAARFTSGAAFPGDDTVGVNTVNQGNKQFNCPENEWAQLGLVWRGESKQATVYVNGKEATIDMQIKRGKGDVGSHFIQGQNYFITPPPLRIGDDNDFQSVRPPIDPFKGSIDDVRIYDRVLSAKEVAELYEMEKPKSNLEKGLVGYYPFNGNAKDDGTKGFHGTVYGAKPAKDRFGKEGRAYWFDGVDDYIDLGLHSEFNIDADSFSISLWVMVDPVPNGGGTLVNKMDAGHHKGYNFRILGRENKITHTGSHDDGGRGTGTETFGRNTIADGGWHHLVFVFKRYDNENWTISHKVYRDGLVEVSRHGPEVKGRQGRIINARNLLVGAAHRTEGEGEKFVNFYHGLIDDIRIYKRALSANEIKELYNLEKP